MNAKRTTPALEFEVEYMNRRLDAVPNAFYPSLSTEKHLNHASNKYDYDDETGLWLVTQEDYRKDQLLNVSLDANAAFTCCTVWQDQKNTENCINALYVKPDQKDNLNLVQKLAFKVLEAYKDHPTKVIHIYGDRNANSRSAGSTTTQFEEFMNVFKAAGWKVVLKASNFNWLHKDKHFFLDAVFAEIRPNLPTVRFNPKKCKIVVMSMQQTPILPDFTKDKTSEKRPIPQEMATHLGDTVDYYLTQKHGYKFGRLGMGGGSGVPVISGLGG